jgi:hypothetical protein
MALKVNPRLLLILAPRHPNRGDEIAQMLQSDRWRYNRRTAGELPEAEANVYLADTMGELGLWYRVAPISLVGGSLQPIGGHNPFEPAALGSAILHGPYVTNFVDIYQRLTEAGAARLVTGPDTLSEAVHELMNPDKAASMAHAAWEVVSQGAEVTDRALDAIFDRLDAGPAARVLTCARRPSGIGRRAFLALLRPLGALYGLGNGAPAPEGAACEGRRARHLHRQHQRGRHGQDPDDHRAGRASRDRGLSVHVVMRGHGGALEGPGSGRRTRHRASDTGDEALLLAAFAKTWVAKDRLAGARPPPWAGADVILLDDGFPEPRACP